MAEVYKINNIITSCLTTLLNILIYINYNKDSLSRRATIVPCAGRLLKGTRCHELAI
jgi:hypothetical protein